MRCFCLGCKRISSGNSCTFCFNQSAFFEQLLVCLCRILAELPFIGIDILGSKLVFRNRTIKTAPWTESGDKKHDLCSFNAGFAPFCRTAHAERILAGVHHILGVHSSFGLQSFGHGKNCGGKVLINFLISFTFPGSFIFAPAGLQAKGLNLIRVFFFDG